MTYDMKKRFAQVALVFTSLVYLSGFFIPTFVSAQTNQNQVETTGPGPFSPQTSLLPVCGLSLTEDGGNIEGCAVRIVYYAILYPSAWLASMGGNIFDWFVGYTLSSDSYSQADFVEKGWRIVRDIANLSFIFVLLYIAFRYVLGLDGRDIQKTLLKIIGIALIINFSLFTTRLIIDAGNILGRVFYERITVTGTGASPSGFTPLSVGLISKVNPQRLLSTKMFAPETTFSANTGQDSNTLGGLGNQSDQETGSTGFMILVLLTAAAVNLVLAYVFFSVGIFFVARTIGLWFQMIFSPIAFLSVAVPKVGGAAGGRFNFSTWLSTTFSLSFMVVVFMFLLYLTIMFLGVAFGSLIDAGENSSGLTLFLEVLIPFIVVAILLLAAKKQAKEMSGEFGGAIVKGLKYAVLGALGTAGLALGGAAIIGGAAGRQTLGRLGAQMTKKEAATGLGRARVRAGKYLQSSTFDTRNVKIPKPLTSGLRSTLSYATGQELGAGDFAVNMNRLGGPSSRTYKTLKEQRIKEQAEKAKDYAASEGSTMRNVQHEYEVEESTVDPATGRVISTKRTVQTTQDKISLAEAKKKKREAELALEEKKEQIHRSENYLDKKRELDRREKDFEKKQKAYEEILNKKKAGDPSVSQRDVDLAEINRNSARTLVDNQKNTIKKVETLYEGEVNEVARFASMVEATKRAVNAKNAEIYNSYADALETWSYMPTPPVNYRGPGDRGAASNVRDMANKEEDKSNK